MRNFKHMPQTIKVPIPIFYRKGFVFEWNGLHICPPKCRLYHSHEFRKPTDENLQITKPFTCH